MRKAMVDFYILFLWVLCGEALYTLFESWWPWQRVFWEGIWTGGLVIALLAALIVYPAAEALTLHPYSEKNQTETLPKS
jgi:hypothetical protein